MKSVTRHLVINMMEDWGFDDATNHNCIHVRMMAMQPANEAKKGSMN